MVDCGTQFFCILAVSCIPVHSVTETGLLRSPDKTMHVFISFFNSITFFSSCVWLHAYKLWIVICSWGISLSPHIIYLSIYLSSYLSSIIYLYHVYLCLSAAHSSLVLCLANLSHFGLPGLPASFPLLRETTRCHLVPLSWTAAWTLCR